MKRSELKRGKPIRRTSKARRAWLSSPERVRVGVQIPSSCELCPLVYDVDSYREFAGLAADFQFRQLAPHHVWNMPRKRWDDPGNVVTVCGVCHSWNHECFQRAGRMVATEALIRAGRFDRDATRERLDYDPIALIEADYQAGIFTCDVVLQDLATVLLGRF